MNKPAAGAPAPAPWPETASAKNGGGFSIAGSPVFMFCILAACTTLAVVLWVGLAYQHKQKNRRRAKAAQEAAARRAALALPVVIVQPDESAVFGAKLYRTPSGDMRPFSEIVRPAAPPQGQEPAASAGRQSSTAQGQLAAATPPPQ